MGRFVDRFRDVELFFQFCVFLVVVQPEVEVVVFAHVHAVSGLGEVET